MSGRWGVILSLFIATVMMVALMGCQVRIGTAIHVRCEEDMSCWDCTTMGNHICGPTLTTRGSK